MLSYAEQLDRQGLQSEPAVQAHGNPALKAGGFSCHECGFPVPFCTCCRDNDKPKRDAAGEEAQEGTRAKAEAGEEVMDAGALEARSTAFLEAMAEDPYHNRDMQTFASTMLRLAKNGAGFDDIRMTIQMQLMEMANDPNTSPEQWLNALHVIDAASDLIRAKGDPALADKLDTMSARPGSKMDNVPGQTLGHLSLEDMVANTLENFEVSMNQRLAQALQKGGLSYHTPALQAAAHIPAGKVWAPGMTSSAGPYGIGPASPGPDSGGGPAPAPGGGVSAGGPGGPGGGPS